MQKTAIPVTSLKVGDEIMLRLQEGARHTGIEIQEFIVEKKERSRPGLGSGRSQIYLGPRPKQNLLGRAGSVILK